MGANSDKVIINITEFSNFGKIFSDYELKKFHKHSISIVTSRSVKNWSSWSVESKLYANQ